MSLCPHVRAEFDQLWFKVRVRTTAVMRPYHTGQVPRSVIAVRASEANWRRHITSITARVVAIST
jgi:hypothetical protein